MMVTPFIDLWFRSVYGMQADWDEAMGAPVTSSLAAQDAGKLENSGDRTGNSAKKTAIGKKAAGKGNHRQALAINKLSGRPGGKLKTRARRL